MRRSVYAAALVGVVGVAATAHAYEYRLQFTPNSGAQGLVVAGYWFSGDTVGGNCSYYTVTSGSGRGGGYHKYYTYYNQTCTWDMYGNLLGIAQGEPTAPPPLYTEGTRTIYAVDAAGDTTGTDTANNIGGFVDTLGAHYSWLTSNAYEVLQQQRYTWVLTLQSDGDVPLDIASVQASALQARAHVIGTTCIGTLPVGATCDVTVRYNPVQLSSPTGLAYDTLTVSVSSNAGQANDFIQSYTIQVRIGGGAG
jgi:hypothetical protein